MPRVQGIDRGRLCMFQRVRDSPFLGKQEGSFHGPGRPCSQNGRCFTIGTQSELSVEVLRSQCLKALVRSEVFLQNMVSLLSRALFVQAQRGSIPWEASFFGLTCPEACARLDAVHCAWTERAPFADPRPRGCPRLRHRARTRHVREARPVRGRTSPSAISRAWRADRAAWDGQ